MGSFCPCLNGREGWDDWPCTCRRKQREVSSRVDLSLSFCLCLCFYFCVSLCFSLSLALSLPLLLKTWTWYSPHLWWVFANSLTQSRNFLLHSIKGFSQVIPDPVRFTISIYSHMRQWCEIEVRSIHRDLDSRNIGRKRQKLRMGNSLIL